jgi:choline dehydrogenase-like flavoprotein
VVDRRTFLTRSSAAFGAVIVGSGAAGGVMARELSTAGFDVVVLERGPYLRPEQIRHDEFAYMVRNELLASSTDVPVFFSASVEETARMHPDLPAATYARMVGGQRPFHGELRGVGGGRVRCVRAR